MPSQLDLALRLLIAAVFAAAVGTERELSDQPAGFRTHLLVGVGAALFTLVSAFGFQSIVAMDPTLDHIDPSRIAAQIVVGVGFLGGGAIIKSGASVRGLTTAASLWVTAAIGTAAAVGAFTLAAATTVISILALALLKPLRTLMRRSTKGEEEFILTAGAEVRLDDLMRVLRDAGATPEGLRAQQDGGITTITARVLLAPRIRPEDVVISLQGVPHVNDVEWSA